MVRSAVSAAVFVLVVLAAPARGQSPPPLMVEAEEIVFDQITQIVEAQGTVRLRYRGIRLTADRLRVDLRREILEAEGRVVLVDAEGRELRGRRLRYDVGLALAEIEQAQAIVNEVYLRSEHLQAGPERYVAREAMVTTCDPAAPGYRITARQVEVIPGDRLVARDAALWLGERRLVALPVYTVSLRPGEAARSFPRVGYNTVEGVWADYPVTYRLGAVEGLLYGKLASQTGLIARNHLTYPGPGYALSLVVGRNQNEDFLLYDQAEAVLDVPGRAVGFRLAGGWFREPATGVESTRMGYEVRLATPTVALGPATTFSGRASYMDAWYGVGARYTVSRANLLLARRVREGLSVSLRYDRLLPAGATPFLFDAVDPEDVIDRLGLQYVWTTPAGTGTTVSYRAGVSHSFLDGTPSVHTGYGRRHEGVFHWDLGGEYNLSTNLLKVTTDVGRALGAGTYATLQAGYFVQTGQFEYLDLLVTSQLCGCFQMSLRYRHVHREFRLEVALAPAAPITFPEEAPAP